MNAKLGSTETLEITFLESGISLSKLCFDQPSDISFCCFLDNNTYLFFLVTLWVPSVTRYAFFDGIHISHTYCLKIILVIVNYFLYYVRDEKKLKIKLN